jgi:RNA recognition motif-containing protein
MTNIYVGNLSYEATEDDVRQAFEAYGEVSSVAIIKDKMTGRSRGFGFVEMPDKNQAQAAIQALNLQEVRGRAMTVNEARPKGEGGGGGGGGRGGFGGGRGGFGGGGGRGRRDW